MSANPILVGLDDAIERQLAALHPGNAPLFQTAEVGIKLCVIEGELIYCWYGPGKRMGRFAATEIAFQVEPGALWVKSQK